jgi:hypothetical protein
MSYITAAGVAVNAIGAYGSANAQKNTYAYQAQIAAQNAQIANQQASQAIINGQTAEQNVRLQGAQVMGSQRASMAANGVDLGQGSANEALTTTKYMTERDALTTKDNALRQAWGYQVQAVNATNEGRMDSYASDSISPGMSAFTSLLGGASTLSKQYYASKKAGAIQ